MIKIYVRFSIRVCKESKNKISSPSKVIDVPQVSFLKFARQEIAHAHQIGCYSMARNYGTAVRSFLCFYGRKDICFHEITPSLMQDYEKWLKSRVGMSTVSCYFRSLRALYNKAVERELCRQKFPFARVYTGYPKTEKRSITVSEVRKLQALKLEAGSFVELARNLFIMSVLLCGMPFVDLAFLKKSQIKNNMLTYNRHKTNYTVRIHLEPCMHAILNRYAESSTTDYVFPLITSSNEKLAYRQYKGKLCYYNKVLKKLGQMANIKSDLTSYVPRYTWASVAYQSGVELPVIAKALGHASSQTSLYYIRGIGDERLHAANAQLAEQFVKVYKTGKMKRTKSRDVCYSAQEVRKNYN